MARILAFLHQLEFTLECVFIPGLPPRHNMLQAFGIELLLTIPEIEEDFSIFLAQAANHEHDLEGLSERVARKGEFVKQFANVCLV